LGVEQGSSNAGWTFLTNHGHVLVCLARDPNTRLRDIAAQVGITERAVQRIVGELEEAGYVERTRVGRRNTYVLHDDLPLRHPLEQHRVVATLLDVLVTGHGEDASV
jgi:DNA-binding Lrp family transcriptional regulator